MLLLERQIMKIYTQTTVQKQGTRNSKIKNLAKMRQTRPQRQGLKYLPANDSSFP